MSLWVADAIRIVLLLTILAVWGTAFVRQAGEALQSWADGTRWTLRLFPKDRITTACLLAFLPMLWGYTQIERHVLPDDTHFCMMFGGVAPRASRCDLIRHCGENLRPWVYDECLRERRRMLELYGP